MRHGTALSLPGHGGGPMDVRPDGLVVFRDPDGLAWASTADPQPHPFLPQRATWVRVAGDRVAFIADGQIGVVGSSYLAGFALVAATSNQWLGRFNWRALVGGGTAVSVASLAACGFATTYGALLATLVIAGASLGVLYTLCIAVISENHRPDSAFGVKLTAEVVLDAYSQVTGVPTVFNQIALGSTGGTANTTAFPPGTRALQLPDALVVSQFLDSFGRPDRSQPCSCERGQAGRGEQRADDDERAVQNLSPHLENSSRGVGEGGRAAGERIGSTGRKESAARQRKSPRSSEWKTEGLPVETRMGAAGPRRPSAVRQTRTAGGARTRAPRPTPLALSRGTSGRLRRKQRSEVGGQRSVIEC